MQKPLALPPGLRVRQALERVLRLPAVASKRYLTNKVQFAVSVPFPLLPRPWPPRGCGNSAGPREKRPCGPALLLPPPEACMPVMTPVPPPPWHPWPRPLANRNWFCRWTAPWAAWWPSSSVWEPCRPPWQMWLSWP